MAEGAINTLQRDDASSQPSRSFLASIWARHGRMILLGLLPAIAIIVGVGFYLAGGRYISTDNAYVGAEKVLITPDISGKVSRVLVREGQHVDAGAPLFEIDPQPFELAVRQAQSKLDTVVTDLANLKSNYQSLKQLVELGQQAVEHQAARRRAQDRARRQADLNPGGCRQRECGAPDRGAAAPARPPAAQQHIQSAPGKR